MDDTLRPESRSLADEALLRGSDDLLVDFDRAFRMFQEFVGGVPRAPRRRARRHACSARRASTRATATTVMARELGRELARRALRRR